MTFGDNSRPIQFKGTTTTTDENIFLTKRVYSWSFESKQDCTIAIENIDESVVIIEVEANIQVAFDSQITDFEIAEIGIDYNFIGEELT